MFDWITSVVEQAGYWGVALLMFAENLFPPIPSELIMPLAGFQAARGQLDVVLVTLAGTAGSLAGALFWYQVGFWLGRKRIKRLAARYGRWAAISPGEVDEASDWFHRHCGKAVFIGRLVPAVRTLISIPAGIARMKRAKFLVYSAAGTVLWSGLLVGAGYLLEDGHKQVATWLNPVSNVVIGALALWYLYRVMTFRAEEENGPAKADQTVPRR